MRYQRVAEIEYICFSSSFVRVAYARFFLRRSCVRAIEPKTPVFAPLQPAPWQHLEKQQLQLQSNLHCGVVQIMTLLPTSGVYGHVTHKKISN